jgi:chromosome segregation ATPase
MPIEKPNPPFDIEALKRKHKDLERQKAMSEANLKTATDQLEALKEEARTKFTTDDLSELKKKLQEMKDQNEQKRANYQKHLEEIQSRLDQVEKNFSTPGQP